MGGRGKRRRIRDEASATPPALAGSDADPALPKAEQAASDRAFGCQDVGAGPNAAAPSSIAERVVSRKRRRVVEEPRAKAEAPAAIGFGAADEAHRRSPLHMAAGGGDLEEVRQLLRSGVDVNERNHLEPGHELLLGLSCTSLHVAAGAGHTAVVEELVAAGADLSCAVSQDREQMEKDLAAVVARKRPRRGAATSAAVSSLRKKASELKPSVVGTTALHIAAFLGKTGVVEALMAAGAPVDAKTRAGATPLLQALSNGHQDAAEALLRGGADPNLTSSAWGMTPILTVVSSSCKVPDRAKVLRALVRAGGDVNGAGEDGRMLPLHIALSQGDEAMVRALLDLGADANLRTQPGGDLPLMAAVVAQSLPLVEALIAAGADVSQGDDDRQGCCSSLLGAAVTTGNERIVRALVAAGADANAPQLNGATPLALGVSAGSPALVAALLHAGADPNRPSGAGAITPLISAVIDRAPAMVRTLLDAGADPNLCHAGTATTALSHAVRNSDAEVVRALVKAGANINGLYSNGMTPLITAVTDGDMLMVDTLLEVGADYNLISGAGFSPLMIASMYGRPDPVRALLRAGANPNQTSKNNNMPLDFAVHHGSREISMLLLDHGARLNGTSDNTASLLVPWLQEERSQLRSTVDSLTEGLPHWCAVAASQAAAAATADGKRTSRSQDAQPPAVEAPAVPLPDSESSAPVCRRSSRKRTARAAISL